MLHLELTPADQREVTKEAVLKLFKTLKVFSLQQKEGCSGWTVAFQAEKDIIAAVSKAKESGLFSKVNHSIGETDHNNQEDYEIVSKVMEEQQLHNKIDGELEVIERILKDKDILQKEDKRIEGQLEVKTQQYQEEESQKIQREEIQNEKNRNEDKESSESSEWGESMDNLALDSQDEIPQQENDGINQKKLATTAETNEDCQISGTIQIQGLSPKDHHQDQENFEHLECGQLSQETCSIHSNQEIDDHIEQQKTTLFLLKCFQEASVILKSLSISSEYYKSQGKSNVKSSQTKSSYFNKAISNRNFRIAVFAIFSVYFAITSART